MKNKGPNLEYREYCLSDDFPILMLSPHSAGTPYSYSYPHYHFHNCLEIGICYEGEHILSFENVDYELSAGNFFIISPYSMHFLNPKKSADSDLCKYIYIKPEELLNDFYPPGLPDELKWYKNSGVPFIFSAALEPDMYTVLNLIVSELSAVSADGSNSRCSRYNRYEYAVKGLVLSLMTKLTRKLSVSSNSSQSHSRYQGMSQVLPALRCINDSCDKPLNVSYLASVCNMSTSGFRTLFTELISETPRHYLNRIRLQKACELLYNTEKTILDISIESGFQSLSNFYRAFDDYFGMAPKEWRNMKRTIQKKNVHHSQFLPGSKEDTYDKQNSTTK